MDNDTIKELLTAYGQISEAEDILAEIIASIAIKRLKEEVGCDAE